MPETLDVDALMKAAAQAVRGSFGMWHGISLLLNFVTLGLLTVAMALAAFLPGKPPIVQKSSGTG